MDKNLEALAQARAQLGNAIDTLRQINLLFTLICSKTEGSETEQCFLLAQIGAELASSAGACAEDSYRDASEDLRHG
ncbi:MULTISPECIES: hypothetical protein [unclassified Caballeronia]|uniref:hypothetical protein n=1 Tax=unclassified Caballeronia TaxID=2646786 RepID=UPI0028638B91|nr:MULTISPECIES: hypothetical protein [unclassified Caballeronia]MDR5770870.1 hypothetical protein [Caballeronia sp. LZ002]MDR5846307.1 hypothetical protein [Caballeronia sp. LZ003]